MMSFLFFAALMALLVVRARTLLVYFQQEEYDAERFLDALISVRLFDVIASVCVIVLLFAGTGLGVPNFAKFLCAAAFAAIAYRETLYTYKKPLVMTDRARRIYWIACAFSLVLALASLQWALLALVALQAVPLCLIGANMTLQPVQEKINEGYVAEAKAKLAELAPVTIGITGSFGKTTVKHILAELLEAQAPTFYSRGSINTVLGLTRHIRQRLQPSHKFFIAEMGAYGIGSITRLCEFAQPTYGIVTAVGHAHTERFGSLENTAIAKAELAGHICAHGEKVILTEAVAALEPFDQLRETYPDKVVVVGQGKDCDVQITQAKTVDAFWEITLRFKGKPRARNLTYLLPLLGDHNVMNSALAIALCDVVAPEGTKDLPLVTQYVEQTPHRLQKKENAAGPLILDDAYNSNELGFRNAINVARDIADNRGGRSILVTPGIAELGDAHDETHARLGVEAGDICDVIIVVNPDRIGSFVSAAGQGSAELVEVATLSAAQAHVTSMGLGADDVVLYENDLPDVLEETRLL
jgi:UDP-N-acetylmuramoyl-tripeptide--D-alanyl-D-alanine ligase